MELSKPPTLNEIVQLDIEDLRDAFYSRDNDRSHTVYSIYTPYFQKCYENDEYWIIFMMELAKKNHVQALALYVLEYSEKVSGERWLKFLYQYRDVANQCISLDLSWEAPCVILTIHCYPYCDNSNADLYHTYPIPIETTEYTKQHLCDDIIIHVLYER